MRCPHICPICGEKCFTYPDALTGGFVHAHEWVNFRDAIEITKRCLSSAAKPSGIDLIAAERQRQIDAEGWTPEHDDEHAGGVLRLMSGRGRSTGGSLRRITSATS
jgi:hypothetical protein